jgi:hypothetical protein
MTQYHRLRFFLAIFLLFAGMMPYVSAFTVSSVDVKPSGFQSAGTSMTVISLINFQAAGAKTFPSDSELQMSTDLVDPYWVPIVVLDGKETRLQIEAGEEMILPGEYLSYSPSQSVQLMVTLSGKIPSDRHSGEYIVNILERDSAKNIVSSAHVAMPEVPLIPMTTPTSPTKKPTIMKTYTPIPTDTTQASPVWTGAAIIAIIGAALVVVRRK